MHNHLMVLIIGVVFSNCMYSNIIKPLNNLSYSLNNLGYALANTQQKNNSSNYNAQSVTLHSKTQQQNYAVQQSIIKAMEQKVERFLDSSKPNMSKLSLLNEVKHILKTKNIPLNDQYSKEDLNQRIDSYCEAITEENEETGKDIFKKTLSIVLAASLSKCSEITFGFHLFDSFIIRYIEAVYTMANNSIEKLELIKQDTSIDTSADDKEYNSFNNNLKKLGRKAIELFKCIDNITNKEQHIALYNNLIKYLNSLFEDNTDQQDDLTDSLLDQMLIRGNEIEINISYSNNNCKVISQFNNYLSHLNENDENINKTVQLSSRISKQSMEQCINKAVISYLSSAVGKRKFRANVTLNIAQTFHLNKRDTDSLHTILLNHFWYGKPRYATLVNNILKNKSDINSVQKQLNQLLQEPLVKFINNVGPDWNK